MATILHDSDCAVHNAPALPVGPCDCGAEAALAAQKGEGVREGARGANGYLFLDWRDLPADVKAHFDRLEEFVGDVDGKMICTPTDGNTMLDDGTVDASDAVQAINGLVSILRASPSPAAWNEAHKRVIEILLDLARAAYEAMDNSSEKSETSDVSIPMEDAGAICNALDALDQLPDDQPGYTMSPNAKAEWALRDLALTRPDRAPK